MAILHIDRVRCYPRGCRVDFSWTVPSALISPDQSRGGKRSRSIARRPFARTEFGGRCDPATLSKDGSHPNWPSRNWAGGLRDGARPRGARRRSNGASHRIQRRVKSVNRKTPANIGAQRRNEAARAATPSQDVGSADFTSRPPRESASKSGSGYTLYYSEPLKLSRTCRDSVAAVYPRGPDQENFTGLKIGLRILSSIGA
jgi:hypothetical protein